MDRDVRFVMKDECDQKHMDIVAEIKELNRRLYQDNGSRSLQTRIAHVEWMVQMITWVVTLIATIWAGTVLPEIIRKMTTILVR